MMIELFLMIMVCATGEEGKNDLQLSSNMKGVFMKGLSGLLAAIFLFASATAVRGSSEGSGMSAAEALKKLQEGNARFVAGSPSTADISIGRRRETAKGQKPFVTVLGCSDSRESLEHIFGAGIGELFVIRVAGNVADTDEIGSIEYGVDHLGTPVLLVLGHTACGAVTAVATGAEVHGHIPRLVDNIVPAVASARKTLGGNPSKDALVERSINENIFQSMRDILSRSYIIAGRVKEGKVKVIGALYHLDSGSIDWLGEHPEQSALVAEAIAEGGHVGSVWGKLLKACGIIMVISALFFYLFISKNRVFSGLKFKTRLALSSLASILSFGVSLLYAFDIYRTGADKVAILFAIPFLLAFVLSVLIAGTHVSSFKKFHEESIRRVKIS